MFIEFFYDKADVTSKCCKILRMSVVISRMFVYRVHKDIPCNDTVHYTQLSLNGEQVHNYMMEKEAESGWKMITGKCILLITFNFVSVCLHTCDMPKTAYTTYL